LAAPEYDLSEIYVPIVEQKIPVVIERPAEDRHQWLPVRPVCEALGVDPSGQLAVLRRNDKYAPYLRPIMMNVKGAWREYMCIHIRMLPRWLDDIDPAKCALKARGQLRAFQDEVTMALQRLLFQYRAKIEQKGIIQSHTVASFVFVCDCGRAWRIVSENGEQYVERLKEVEE
jgi:hypothetical protein